MGHHIFTVRALAAATFLLVATGDRATAAPRRHKPAAATPAPSAPAPAASIEGLLDLVAVKQAPAEDSSLPAVRNTAAAEVPDAAAIPPGAPDDDYGLVAWCEGALSGHMALFPVVKPELDRMEQTGDKAKDAEMDAAQMAAGTEYLQLYARARHAADVRGDGAPLRAEGLTRAGQTLWAPVRAADANARMWSWVMWELPARCETAARRLEGGTSAPSDVLRRHSSDDPAPSAAQATQATKAATDSPDRR